MLHELHSADAEKEQAKMQKRRPSGGGTPIGLPRMSLMRPSHHHFRSFPLPTSLASPPHYPPQGALISRRHASSARRGMSPEMKRTIDREPDRSPVPCCVRPWIIPSMEWKIRGMPGGETPETYKHRERSCNVGGHQSGYQRNRSVT